MNLYEISSGETEWQCDENGDDYLCNVVYHFVAPTRGRAKYLFIHSEVGNGWELTDPMRIIQRAKNVELPEGQDEDFVWAQANDPEFKLIEY